MTDSEKQPKKRRLQNACDACRRRKVRCDGSTMPGGVCSACQAMRVPCTHLRQNKKRGKKISVPANTEEIKFMVTFILSETPEETFPIPQDHEAIREVLVDLAKYIRYLEKELARSRRPHPKVINSFMVDPNTGSGTGNSPENEESSGDELGQSDTEDLQRRLASMQVSRLQNRHFGKSSNALFFMDILGLKKYPDICKRLEFWSALTFEFCGPAIEEPPSSFDFPNDAHLRELVNVYFTLHHPYYPLLHKPSFERDLSEGLHHRDEDFGKLVLALCALASRYTDDSRNLPQPHHSSLGLGWKWLQQVNLFKRPSLMSLVSLHELQTYCLVICFLLTTGKSDFSWMLNGFGIRLAQQRGIHRRKSNPSKGKSAYSLENELWKRAFSILIYHDICTSSGLGRPVAVSINEYDLEPLVEHEGEDMDDTNLSGKVSGSGTSSASSAVFWNCCMRLVEILIFAEQTLNPIRRSALSVKITDSDSGSNWNRKVVDEINSALTGWLFSVPKHLRWDPQRENLTFFAQSSALHMTFYWIQIRIHRSFIPRKGESSSPANVSSIAICANAARACINVLDVLQRRHPQFACHFPISAAAYHSAIIVLFNIFRGKEFQLGVDLKEEISDAHRCIGFLQKRERVDSVCACLRDILDTIFGNHLLSQPSNKVTLAKLSDAQGSKHPREDGDDPISGQRADIASNEVYPNSERFGTLHSTSTGFGRSSTTSLLQLSPTPSGSGSAQFHIGSNPNVVSSQPAQPAHHSPSADIHYDQSFHQQEGHPFLNEIYSGWSSESSLLTQSASYQQSASARDNYSAYHNHDGYDAAQMHTSESQNPFGSWSMMQRPSDMNYVDPYSYHGPGPDVSELSQQTVTSMPLQDQAKNWDPSTILEVNNLFQWYSGHTA
ncbi:hypothetical protein K435DRAFT_423220 [Dendrothele bispora CBS 962.96]|uniref:Zn(2)-C6 fungal-type domain-containing protein n=1 Tax=Dendrothele bispora (strain CBS 962.96) TaxID=1314807 RepID=A0A4S8L6K8_DENBC|nr:hypothetical protein K435DRAFT_423220 [Dendrothele bispora CBS 962.96]